MLYIALGSMSAECRKSSAWVSLSILSNFSELDRLGCQMTNDISYLQESSRHRQVMPLYEAVPQTTESWIAPNAALVGDVFVSKWATVWYNVTIRAEHNPVRIG